MLIAEVHLKNTHIPQIKNYHLYLANHPGGFAVVHQ